MENPFLLFEIQNPNIQINPTTLKLNLSLILLLISIFYEFSISHLLIFSYLTCFIQLNCLYTHFYLMLNYSLTCCLLLMVTFHSLNLISCIISNLSNELINHWFTGNTVFGQIYNMQCDIYTILIV